MLVWEAVRLGGLPLRVNGEATLHTFSTGVEEGVCAALMPKSTEI
jgi:hypothetical protein